MAHHKVQPECLVILVAAGGFLSHFCSNGKHRFPGFTLNYLALLVWCMEEYPNPVCSQMMVNDGDESHVTKKTYCWWFRNPAPVEVGSLSHSFQGVFYISGGDRRICSINSITKTTKQRLSKTNLVHSSCTFRKLKMDPLDQNVACKAKGVLYMVVDLALNGALQFASWFSRKVANV